jgi:formimidoylglutamate deiminase
MARRMRRRPRRRCASPRPRAQTGIGLTMLPVLYAYAGFGDAPLKPEQKRFRSDPGQVLGIVEALEPLRGGQLEAGAAPHSLRAASIGQIRELAQALPAGRPLHIHIAEQQAEVAQCLDATGRRPVEYLMDQHRGRCALVPGACDPPGAARDGAAGRQRRRRRTVPDAPKRTSAMACFPLESLYAAGGRFGIGSDSHVSQSPVEELRWLEYGQRLAAPAPQYRRHDSERDVGAFLWRQALQGGAQAAGRRVGSLARACAPTCWCSTRPSEPRRRAEPKCSDVSCSAATTTWCATCSRAAAGWCAADAIATRTAIAQRYIAAVRELRSA